jgi:Cu2+-exporting ATPase
MSRATASTRLACYHCGLPVVDATRHTLPINGETRLFCCPACLAVAHTIVDSGLGSYYRYREQDGAQSCELPQAVSRTDFSHWDRPELQRRWLRALGDGEVEIELLIGGMHCAACVWLLEHHLQRLDGVSAVRVNLGEQRASVRWRLDALPLSAIGRAVAEVGYQPQPYTPDAAEQLRAREEQALLRRLGVALIGSMQVGMLAVALYSGEVGDPWRDLMRVASLLLTLPVILYSAQPFFSGAWRAVRLRRAGMDLPVAVALALATAASIWATWRGTGEVYYESVTMFVFLLLGARYLEMRARHYGGRRSGDLRALLPLTTTRLSENGSESVAIDELQIDDRLLVAAGATLPADGELLDNDAAVSEAALTGEFLPVPKRPGDRLLAGSVNGDQPLLLRVTATGADLYLAAVQRLGLQAHKPRLAQLADRIASQFTALILLLWVATWIGWHFVDPGRAFWVALSVLVVSCPCALGLATPAAITAATNRLRQLGLLVTRGDAWEQLPRITDVIFDKTGTLTEGAVRIADIRPLAGRSAEVCRAIASALESGSSHPIARAFAQPNVEPAQQRRHVTGGGVEGMVAGRRYRLGSPGFALDGNATPAPAAGHWVLLAEAGAPLCWFRLDDTLRRDAASSVLALQQRGLRVHLLSGDPSDAALALAQRLGIEHVEAGASPARKLDYLRALQGEGRRVLMVGDGINDIPVLAAADVSVAMSDASQLAKTSADCIFLSPRLDRLPALLELARRTRTNIRENLGWALLYNVVALPAAAGGLVAPWLAALGMSASSLLVVGNALRLQRVRLTTVREPH